MVKAIGVSLSCLVGGGSEGIIFYVTSESKEKRNFLSSRTRDNGLT